MSVEEFFKPQARVSLSRGWKTKKKRTPSSMTLPTQRSLNRSRRRGGDLPRPSSRPRPPEPHKFNNTTAKSWRISSTPLRQRPRPRSRTRARSRPRPRPRLNQSKVEQLPQLPQLPQPPQEDPKPVEEKKQRLTPLQYIEHLPYLPDDITSRDIFEMAIDIQKVLVNISEEQVAPLYDAVEHLIEHQKYRNNDKGGLHYPVIEDRRLSLSSLDHCKKPLKEVFVKRLIYLRLLEKPEAEQREVGFAAFVDHCTFF